MKIIRFLDHYGLLILLIVVSVVAFCAYFWHWADPQTLQAVSTLAVTVILALVTWHYVRTTQKTLALFREQWEYQQKLGIVFGIKKRNDKAWIRIANTGGVRLLLSKAVFHRRGKKPFTRNTLRMIGEGRNYGFYVPLALYKDEPHNCDVDVTLHYQGYAKGEETVSKAFRIELLRGKVYHIKRGIHEWWSVPCPKCGQKMIMMNTEDLENHEAAFQREAEMKEHLEVSCPLHQSPWMDTVETINERQKREQSRIEE